MKSSLQRPARAVIHQKTFYGGTILGNIVRRLRADPAPLSDRDDQFLKDVLRGRYTLATALPRLVDISASRQTSDAVYALREEVTAAIDGARASQLDLLQTSREKCEADGQANVAQFDALATRDPAKCRVAMEATDRVIQTESLLYRALALVVGRGR